MDRAAFEAAKQAIEDKLAHEMSLPAVPENREALFDLIREQAEALVGQPVMLSASEDGAVIEIQWPVLRMGGSDG